MKRWKQIAVVGLVLVAVLVIAGSALALSAPRAVIGPQAVAAYDISWDVVASGGTTMSSGSYTMLSTSGQPAVGQSAAASYTVQHGYWTNFLAAIEDLLLPIIMRP